MGSFLLVTIVPVKSVKFLANLLHE